jgi:hypothetical protein
MLALFRNPLLRLLGRLWWLPALAIVLASAAVSRDGLKWIGTGMVAYAMVVVGLVGAAWVNAGTTAVREHLRRRAASHRFLCPRCLQFGGFRFACGACGTEIEPFVIHTLGAYTDDCPSCHARVISREHPDSRWVRAYCRGCGGRFDRAIYHGRQVRVAAALVAADFQALYERAGVRPKSSQGVRFFEVDGARPIPGEEARLTYVVSLADLPRTPHALPATHALESIKHLWLSGGGIEPLELGRRLDHLIRRQGWSEAKRQAMMVSVGLEAPHPAVRKLLEGRFGAVRCGVSPDEFLGVPCPVEQAGTRGYPGVPAQRVDGSSGGQLRKLPGIARSGRKGNEVSGKKLDRVA